MHLGDVSAVGGQVGYHFNSDWSIEAAYAANNGHLAPKPDHKGNGDHQIGMTSATLAYRLWSNDAVSVSGLLGIQHLEMDHVASSTIDDSATLPTVGVAVSHYFTDQIELRGTVQAGYNRGMDYSDLYSAVGVNYHFGTHEAAAAPVAAPVVAPVAKEPVVIMKKTLHAHFDHDKSIVRADDKKEIAEVAAAMQNNPGSKADLVGHTDSNGADEYNQALSERRAAAVKAELVKQGANASDISTSGKGEKEPVADNATAKGRAENRRVEAVVTGQ
jgi:OOP family OmpA-OmpF porin